MKQHIQATSCWTDYDVYLFKQGKHLRLYEKFGCHIQVINGVKHLYFSVWAPQASLVCLAGDFNFWNKENLPMQVRWDSSGIWELTIPYTDEHVRYKYIITNRETGAVYEKMDPFERYHEPAPGTASALFFSSWEWNDLAWMEHRSVSENKPLSIYEIHAGSWRRITEDHNRILSWRELAEPLAGYVEEMGFTHVELLPVMQHPFYGSWGYQVLGYFASDSRYGTPDDFKYFVNFLHNRGIGVILDWVPAHFPSDAFGLAKFDGSCVYEHPDLRKGYHPDWKSLIFNYERPEVRSFLISSALFWLTEFHIDGLRVDAVASMLYLDYSRKDGEWEPNRLGGNHNLDAIRFLKDLNEAVRTQAQDAFMIAEESTAWQGVTSNEGEQSLGFHLKWMMGWMHDSLNYFKKDPVYRSHHQNEITFSLHYVFGERFMLPLSHDEVVHGKGSILDRMPGDEWQRFANLRLLYGWMFLHPGSKMLFMGNEFAQGKEWNHEASLDWHLLDYPNHRGIQILIKTLNIFYRRHAALHDLQYQQKGFEWIDFSDQNNCVVSFLRISSSGETCFCIMNLTPVPRTNYRVGIPYAGTWNCLLNSDDTQYGGSNLFKKDLLISEEYSIHGRPFSLKVDLPPLAVLVYSQQAKQTGHRG